MESMAPRKTSDGRDVPRLLGARQRTMALLAAVLEDEARREAPQRWRRRSESRSRVGFVLAAALGCVLSAVAGGVGAWSLETPRLDALDEALQRGDLDALDDALERVDPDSARARSGRALARTQQAVWGSASTAEASLALRDGDGPHHERASALISAMRGDAASDDAWSAGIAAGRSLVGLRAATASLQRTRERPAGASRTLAALQFTLGDVSAALATLDATNTAGADADAAFYGAWVRADTRSSVAAVPGRAALLSAKAAVEAGDHDAAGIALAEARTSMLPWDPVATTAALRLSFLAADVQGLRAWAGDSTFSEEVRELAGAYAEAASGNWDAAESTLRRRDDAAPWVAYVLGYAAAERGRWPRAVRLAATARRGMPGRIELEVLSAWVGAHFLDAGGAHHRLLALTERAPWAPRLWTARAQAAAANGRPDAEVFADYERALEVESRPAGAAAALAAHAPAADALHLWTMAVEFDPTQPDYRVALGEIQAERGHLREAWVNLASTRDADAEVWLTLVELSLVRRADVGELRVDGWLDAAAAAGAPEHDVERLRLQLRLARGETIGGDAASLARRRPDDAAAVALAVRALGAEGRVLAARQRAVRARRTVGRRERPIVTLALANVLRGSGEVREAAQLAFKAWSALPSDAHAIATFAAARDAVDAWLELGNTNGARAIARDLTQRLPNSPDAWLLRAEVQRAAGAHDFACRSIGRAHTLDPNADIERGSCQDDAI